jgi:hypothetical protein
MSYFDDASLVMIPSGYKDQKVYSVKPVDGSGDLTFSRASSATRVASNGLIEKVRTNQVLQSNTFNAASWVSAGPGATVTSGQTDPDGGTSAWLISKSGITGRIEQNITTAANEQTFSIVAKKGTANFIAINVYDGTTSHVVYFNINSGVVGSQSNAVGSIVSLGSGWYRCSLTSTNVSGSGIIELYISDTDVSVTGATGNIFIYESQFENGVATDYIATTSAAVSVGPVSGLPRLDYLNSTCPRLLLEPQRSSLVTFSENFDNSAWIKTATTITANNAVSPDGYTNADLLLETAATSNHAAVSDLISFVSGTTYTMSVFAKNISGGRGLLQVGGYQLAGSLQDTFANFNLATGVVTQQTQSTAKIENYGNGWYRCSVTFACTNTISERLNVTLINSGTAGFSPSYAGDITKGIYVWGAQMEAGAYATSYIPTLGTSVTRVADAASKTGISSLIGQTEGAVFFEIDQLADVSKLEGILYLSDGTSTTDYINFYFAFSNILYCDVAVGGVTQASFNLGTITTLTKIALAYKANDFAVYKNGVQIGTDNSGSVPTTNKLTLGATQVGSAVMKGVFAQALLFKTRLTNAQLAELTTL